VDVIYGDMLERRRWKTGSEVTWLGPILERDLEAMPTSRFCGPGDEGDRVVCMRNVHPSQPAEHDTWRSWISGSGWMVTPRHG
jgi:hypothetical protein